MPIPYFSTPNARSLEDYEHKVLTGHKAENRYSESPLALFWERDRNDVLSPIAADYACRVRALIELAKEMEAKGDLGRAALHAHLWNTTGVVNK